MLLAVALPALRSGPLDGERLAREVLAGEALRGRITSSRPSRRHDVPAVDARARPEVDDVVGGAQGLLVVLDDDEGVADVAQVHERVDEPLVVALVEADGGLVEDVEHADEGGADLRGEP